MEKSPPSGAAQPGEASNSSRKARRILFLIVLGVVVLNLVLFLRTMSQPQKSSAGTNSSSPQGPTNRLEN